MDTLVSRALMIRLSLHPSPASEMSAFNNTRAFSSRCAGLFPFRISASSCSRSRAGEYQQHGGTGDQEIAGGSDPECRVDAEGNAGDNGNARSENACRPLMPQNHGVGPVLIAETKRMPVGIRSPLGSLLAPGAPGLPC